MRIRGFDLDDFTAQYLRTALWAETVCLPCDENDLVDNMLDVDEDHPLYNIMECASLDDHFDIEDLNDDSLQLAITDCNRFRDWMDSHGLTDPADSYCDDEDHGHNFWLTRNGHGAGFFDGDYGDELGKKLTEGCKTFGACHVQVCEDGTLELWGM